jgi:hypothetical protein
MFKSIDQYPDTWSVAQGNRIGKPIFVRFRDGLKEAVGHPQYPIQIGIAVPLLHPTNDGLPEDSEAKELDTIESHLKNIIVAGNGGVFVMTLTTNGMREFVFYFTSVDTKGIQSALSSLNIAPHELQVMIQEDPYWDTYKSFLGPFIFQQEKESALVMELDVCIFARTPRHLDMGLYFGFHTIESPSAVCDEFLCTQSDIRNLCYCRSS